MALEGGCLGSRLVGERDVHTSTYPWDAYNQIGQLARLARQLLAAHDADKMNIHPPMSKMLLRVINMALDATVKYITAVG